MSGNRLLENCSAADVPITASAPEDTPVKEALCYGFLMGADQAISTYAPQTYCLKKGVDFKQIRLVLMKFLNNHPELLHKPAVELYSRAMTEAFPCHSSP